MRSTVLLCCLLITLGLQAQSTDWFAPVGATWTYYGYTNGPPHYYIHRPYFQVEIVKDSVILGRDCRKLIAVEADGSIRDSSTVWLHVDSTRIYFLEQDTFKLFFDKAAKVGDTLIYWMPANYKTLDYTCCYVTMGRDWEIRIDSIKMVDVGGENLQRWYYSSADPQHVTQFWEDQFFTDKIGMTPFFGVGDICCLAGFWGDFHCYEDQTTFINVDTVDCTYPVGVGLPTKESIQVVPNPAGHYIEIILSSITLSASAQYQLYSLDGRLIKESTLNSTSTRIPLEVPAGLYLLQVQVGDSQFIQRVSVIR